MPRTADIRVTVDADSYEAAVVDLESVAIEVAKIDGVLSARLRPVIEDGTDKFAANKGTEAESER